MKKSSLLFVAFTLFTSAHLNAQNEAAKPTRKLYMDVHHIADGKVAFADVAAAHAKDLAVQDRYNVQFLKYWVDEVNGKVYCLSSANDTSAITHTHREAHGLLPQEVFEVKDGLAADAKDNHTFFLDVHKLGAGNVTAADVEKAHQKDLAVQEKHGVHFINYWVNEKDGTVLCLSQAKDASKVIQTHKEAHGLIPATVVLVKQGQ